MLTTLTCGVQQRPKNIQRVMVNGFSGAVDASMKDLGEDINTAHCKHPVVIFSFPSFINWEAWRHDATLDHFASGISDAFAQSDL